MTVPAKKVRKHIDAAITVAVERVKARADELFTSEIASSGNGTAAPFQKLLFPEGRIFSSFERSLSASLGKAFDYIAADIARATYGNGEHDYHLSGSVPSAALAKIEDIVTKYKQRIGATPDTVAELAQLSPILASSQVYLDRVVKSDVFFIDHEGFENYLEIKTSMPNYDQCASMKTRILTIYCMRWAQIPKVRALNVFPHNPNGMLGVYSWPPLRYFLDPNHDWYARGNKLMGAGLWNFVGNSNDTYEELLECFYQVSINRRDELLFVLMNTGTGAPE